MTQGNVNLRKFDKMGVLSFENALRIHKDAILLFQNKSYPSAYALSVLSLEELGKYLVLEDFVWHSRTDGKYTPKQEEEIIRLTYDHRYKQNKFAVCFDLPMFAKKAIRHIFDGTVEKTKQKAFYVGLTRKGKRTDLKGRISTPASINRKKAEKQITVVNDFILCRAAGSVKGTNIGVIWELEELLTHELIKKLRKLWPKMGQSARREFNNIMRLEDYVDEE